MRSSFEPCIPTPGTKVPDSKNWIHEIKHDGYRLIVQREGQRVRLWTRNGHDWSGRFPLISEAALRNRNSSFVIDGEAVLLGVDGRSDFNGLHSRKHDDEVQFYAFDCLVNNGDDLRRLPLTMSAVHHRTLHTKSITRSSIDAVAATTKRRGCDDAIVTTARPRPMFPAKLTASIGASA